MSNLALDTIGLFKEYISSGSVDMQRLADTQKTLAFAIDDNMVNNRPTDELESLYESVMWLRCDVLKL